MARRTFGPISDLFDLKGRRRALEALQRAFPELSDQERRGLARQSLARHRQCLQQERRQRFPKSSVDFCRGLTFEGWENLHNASVEPFFLLAPLGSLEVATRVLKLYHQGHEHDVLILAMDPKSGPRIDDDGESTIDGSLFRQPLSCSARPARRALQSGAPAVWILAIPESRGPRSQGQWRICFQPPIPPLSGDTAHSLTERYLGVLEEAIRCHPDSWPWRELG